MKQSESGRSLVDNGYYFIADSLSENIDAIILAPKDYEDIFGTTRKRDNTKRKRLAVVKASSGGRSIHRRYLGDSSLKEKRSCALNYSSINELCVDDNIPQKIDLSKGNMFAYYWNNPKASIRMSMRLGILSIILGFIAIAIAILPFFHCL